MSNNEVSDKYISNMSNLFRDINRDYSYADYQYEILCEQIKEFQDTLDNNHEVGLITPFNSSNTFVISSLGFHNPNLIYFYGFYGDYEAQVIQHINQINLLLVATPKADPNKPARRIGFEIPSLDE